MTFRHIYRKSPLWHFDWKAVALYAAYLALGALVLWLVALDLAARGLLS